MNSLPNSKQIMNSKQTMNSEQVMRSVHEILPGLWLGSETAAGDENFFKSHGIHSVVNCTTHIPNHFESKGIKYLRVPVYDSPDQDIDKYFNQAHAFILNQLRIQGHGVLIHCQAGISRSSSVLISFLIKKLNIPYDIAYKIVKNKRAIIQPNSGFETKLKRLKH